MGTTAVAASEMSSVLRRIEAAFWRCATRRGSSSRASGPSVGIVPGRMYRACEALRKGSARRSVVLRVVLTSRDPKELRVRSLAVA